MGSRSFGWLTPTNALEPPPLIVVLNSHGRVPCFSKIRDRDEQLSNIAGRAVYSLSRHISMRRTIMVYAALSVAVAIEAVSLAGPWSGVCAILAPPLMATAAGGMKAMFFWGGRNQKIFGVVTAFLVGAVAVRLAPGFSVYVPNHSFGGPAWTVIGGFLAFFASNRANWEAGH